MRLRLALPCACLSFFTASGCATQLGLPANRFDTPEVRGALGKSRVEPVALAGGNAVDIQGGSSDEIASSYLNYQFGYTLGLGESVDAALRIQPNAPVMARFKYQLYGMPELKAEPRSFSAALTGAAGLLLGGQSETTYARTLMVDAGAVVGYRFSPRFLVYGGAYYGFFTYSGEVSGKVADGTALQPGFFLGCQWWIEDLTLKLELSRASGTVGESSQVGYYPGIQIGARL